MRNCGVQRTVRLANRMFYALGALAYNLMKAVQLLCLPDERVGAPSQPSIPKGFLFSSGSTRRPRAALASTQTGSYYFAFNLTLIIQGKAVRDWRRVGADSSWRRRWTRADSTAAMES